MKKTALIITFLLVFMSFCAYAAVGDIAGNIYSTDIKTYVDGMEIPSYNIGGRTVIEAERLIDYGFYVEWRPDTRALIINSGRMPLSAPAVENRADNTVGEVIGSFYETDITVRFNQMFVKSYNIGGKTVIEAEDLASQEPEKQFDRDSNLFYKLGKSGAGASAVWDGDNRALLIDFIRSGKTVKTDDGKTWDITGDRMESKAYSSTGLYLGVGDVTQEWVTAFMIGEKIYVPVEIYEKYKNETEVVYDYASTRGSCYNNLVPLENNGLETYYYKGEAYICLSDTVKTTYKYALPES